MRRNQLERLLEFPSKKKAAERLLQLFQAGHVKRVQYFQPGMQGRAEFVYYQGRCPAHQILRHSTMVSELRVQTARSFTPQQEYKADFFYGNELVVTSVRPDAAIVAQRGAKTALVLLEADCGTERLISPTAYSLLGKLRDGYAPYFDSEQYQKDFSWAGSLRGFRVALVLLSPARLVNIQRLVAANGLDFVLLATMDDIVRDGIHAPVWRSHDGRTFDLFGRHHA